MPITHADLAIKTLGRRAVRSPLGLSTKKGDGAADYILDDARVLFSVEARAGDTFEGAPLSLEKAGPREEIFFVPSKVRAGIVTCGGLCPGINSVIRSMVLELHHRYRVAGIRGYRYGYEGLVPGVGLPPIDLGPEKVRSIHKEGGSILGLSRGKQDIGVMADTLVREGIDILFAIGGDGTLRGAHLLHEELQRRGLPISVVGVPKTIDNDVAFVDRTFGFNTAVEVACQAIDAAHAEAIGARNGVGIVKLMGRDAGFVAAAATMASVEVNFCLVPEARFELEGPHGLLRALERRLHERGHAVVVVAEGCGVSLATENAERDPSGNLRYASDALDVGTRLRDAVVAHLKAVGMPATVKYIDPSYMIRSVPANSTDNLFSDSLARAAVHAGMAGKTDLVIGYLHGHLTHVPLALVTAHKKRLDPDGPTWLAVIETTGQPALVNSPPPSIAPLPAA